MVDLVFTRGVLLLTVAATVLFAASHYLSSATRITDPLPEPLQESDFGVRLVPFAHVDVETPPRLNMLKSLPDGRMFVNEQSGQLYLISKSGEVRSYLRLQDYVSVHFPGEHRQQLGFLAFAFHPHFADNGIFYTVSTDLSDGRPDFFSKRPIRNRDGKAVGSDHYDVLRRWVAKDPRQSSFSGSVSTILRIEQPYRDHNTGEIAFNPLAQPGQPDFGLLYIGVADGGSDGFPVAETDPLDNGQDLSTPLGAILRIDPEAASELSETYGIPASNPWAQDGDPRTLGEIYAYGFRNPHRFTWHPESGHMLAFDIGQWFIEEINVIVAGGNYGWGNREGLWVVDERDEQALYPRPAADREYGYRYPWAMYDHPGQLGEPLSGPGAIGGGFVYRGRAIPELRGRLVFADFTADGRFFVIDGDAVDASAEPDLAKVLTLRVHDGQGRPSTASRIIRGVDGQRTDVRFGEDEEGELYVTNKHNGWIYRLAAVR